MSLRSGRSSPLTSPVLQEPAKRGGRGTSKSKYVQNLMDSASHSLVLFEMQPCRCDTSEDELKEWEEFRCVTLHQYMCIFIIMIKYVESGSKCRAGLDGRVSRGKPLTSPVLQGPAKPGRQGTSKGRFEMHIRMDSVTLGL